ncbi:MAG TPA: thiamine pyrophosphate-dependent enzyme [Candidatus Binatia bacterium]|jgi:indolepyruvate decarboxylase|nr:thiamine pyrophosphate-dependent enzyme [Candidatus Binatia bacterium]
METSQSIGTYLIQRLYAYGVRHVFGVPGDYVLGFFQQLVESPLQVVNTCDEQGAGFAADAYARVRGLGAVCVTYCVGGLKVANTTAQAFAEKSPVVVISGAPGTKERVKNPLLHHKVRDFDTQHKVFEQLTVASTVLSDPETALREIDRVLAAAMRYRRPVYIELPRDMISASGLASHRPQEAQDVSDPESLGEAIREATDMINQARQPVIIAGIELHRFGLQDALLQLIEKTDIPVAAMLLSKSVIGERHPRYLGVYEGAFGYEEVRAYVESSDCLILLGAIMSDMDLGMYTANIDQGRSISVTSEKTSIRHHVYEGILLEDFLQGLIAGDIKTREPGAIPHPEPPVAFSPVPGAKITVRRMFQRLNAFLDDDTVVIAEPGDSLFGSADLFIHGHTEFLSPAYYTSMGFAVPACIGAQLANPQRRPLVIVGDGGFQMTGMELSTAVRFRLNPIVVVLNNSGYGTERPMLDGPFNDILPWQFSRIPEILGSGKGFNVETEEQLDTALQAARAYTDGFCILDVHLDSYDISPALQRMTNMLGKRVK